MKWAKRFEFVVIIVVSVVVSLIQWEHVPWPVRLWSALLFATFAVWQLPRSLREWREARRRNKELAAMPRESFEVFVTWPMLVAIVFGAIGVVWILWASALGSL